MKRSNDKPAPKSIQDADLRSECDRDSPPAPAALGDVEVDPDRSSSATIPAASTTSPTPRLPEILSALGGMNTALASSTDLHHVIELRNKAEALEHIVSFLDRSARVVTMAATLRLRAERQAGAMLASRDKHPGGRPKSNLSQEETGYPLTLTQLGIRRSTASRWQQVAAVPEHQFESYLRDREATKKPPTTAGLLSHVAGDPGAPDYDRDLQRLTAGTDRMAARWPDRRDQIAAELRTLASRIETTPSNSDQPPPANEQGAGD